MTDYSLNIDLPTDVARFHNATSRHPDWQPREKLIPPANAPFEAVVTQAKETNPSRSPEQDLGYIQDWSLCNPPTPSGDPCKTPSPSGRGLG